jgi:hypothetical protein
VTSTYVINQSATSPYIITGCIPTPIVLDDATKSESIEQSSQKSAVSRSQKSDASPESGNNGERKETRDAEARRKQIKSAF